MNRASAITRPTATAANQRLADAVGESLAGQQHAGRVIPEILALLGDGNELMRTVDAIADRLPAFRRGFFKSLQRRLERGAAG